MAGERLIALIADSDLVARLRTQAATISADDRTMARFSALLDLQKRFVKASSNGSRTRAESFGREYREALEALIDAPIVADYLALVDELDDVVQEVTAILNEGIAR